MSTQYIDASANGLHIHTFCVKGLLTSGLEEFLHNATLPATEKPVPQDMLGVTNHVSSSSTLPRPYCKPHFEKGALLIEGLHDKLLPQHCKLKCSCALAICRPFVDPVGDDLQPFHAMAYPFSAELALAISAKYAEYCAMTAARMGVPPLQHPPNVQLRPGERLKVAYVSSRLRQPPTLAPHGLRLWAP